MTRFELTEIIREDKILSLWQTYLDRHPSLNNAERTAFVRVIDHMTKPILITNDEEGGGAPND